MRQWTTFMAALILAAGGVRITAAAVPGVEDDLAIVKKAVASPASASAPEAPPTPTARVTAAKTKEGNVTARAQATPPVAAAAPEPRPSVRSGREPQWFKVRVVERGTGRKKVTVNLPLSLVRALGDDNIDWGCRGDGADRHCHTVRLSEVLRSLESGQELVEVEDEDATVKVWVE